MLYYDGMINYMKIGVEMADAVTTVSPSYANEITTEYFGFGLDRLLRERAGKLVGIVNGLDYGDADPARDANLFAPYDMERPEGKRLNKTGLQHMFQLKEDDGVPLVCMVSRLAEPKGIDLVLRVFDELMEEDMQFVILGTGERRYELFFEEAQRRYPGRVGCVLRYNPAMSRRIYAGADIFLMPSKSEPCGLAQLMAMRYGAPPVVRETGGLRDTVRGYDEGTGEGNGFTFADYNAHDMLHTLRRALRLYGEPEVWSKIQRNCMSYNSSWAVPAGEYLRLYKGLFV